MMTTFEFWASGSSTLATSAAVKTDSDLPARVNQVRLMSWEDATPLARSCCRGPSSKISITLETSNGAVLCPSAWM